MKNDITLYGFYNYDPSILTDLDLPEGLNEEMVRFTILDNAGMLFPYHQVLPQLSTAIHMWFTQNKDNFARILAAIGAEYNPIENYDRMEDRTLKTDNTSQSTANSGTVTHSGSTSTSQRAADNSESFRNVDRNTGSADSNGTSNSSSNGTSTENVTENLRVHGNIGVMTNQMMVSAELDLRRYNIYEDICNRFVDKFLIGVYD